ncbi:MAG: hypothetical protein N2645_04445 [Clostridia bacterium]|nr:hypothetical protein [Clostridia bacterium]
MGQYKSKQSGEAKTVKRTGSFIVSAVLLLFALGFHVFNAFVGGSKLDSASRLGYIGAVLLIIAIVTFLIFRFKSVHKRATGMLIFSTVIIISGLGVFTLSLWNMGSEAVQTNDIKTTYKRILSTSVGGNIVSEELSEAAYGQNAKYLTVLVQSLNEVIILKRDFLKKISEINQLGISNQILEDPGKMDVMVKAYKDLKEYVTDYEIKYEDLVKKMRQSVSDLKVNESEKQAFLKGFDESIGKNAEKMKQYFNIEKGFADANVELLQFLKNAKGKYKYSDNDGFQFNNKNDTDTFGKFYGKVDDAVKQESKWLEDNNKRLLELQQSINNIN